jgi:hypothetical protein
MEDRAKLAQSNLVLYVYDNWPLWSSGTQGRMAAYAIMQGDGNFVIYDTSNVAVWSSNSWGNPGAYLVLQDDGNVVIYGPDNRVLWATMTVFNFGYPKQVDSGVVQLAHNEFASVHAQLSDNGRLDGETHIWTQNALNGFTGGTAIFLLDSNQNVLWNSQMHSMGVDGTWILGMPSSRDELWNEQYTGDLSKVSLLKAWCMLTPQNRLIDDVNTGAEIVGKVWSVVQQIIGTNSKGQGGSTTPTGPVS